MKRSRSLKLALMSATVLTLSACDSTEDVAVFETLEQCVNQNGFSQEACEANLQAAQREHARVAPKYTSVADCEADFGAERCETAPQQTTSGGSIFMPLMMGYMMGNMLAGPSRVATQPLYRSKDNPGNFRTADNKKIAGQTGLTKAPASATRPPTTKTRTVRRGGFGATAARSAGRVRSFGG